MVTAFFSVRFFALRMNYMGDASTDNNTPVVLALRPLNATIAHA